VSTSIPSKIQQSDLSQIYDVDPLDVSGFRTSEVHASTHLKLPFSEIPRLRFTPPLNRMVNSLPMIYDVDHFEISSFGFQRCSSLPISRLCEIRKVFATNSSVTLPDLTVKPSSHIYSVDLLSFSGFWEFTYRDSHAPVQLQRFFFKPCAHFPDPTVTRVHYFPPEQIPRLQHHWCGFLSPCGHIPHPLWFHNTVIPPDLVSMVK
jgi:hypothetical protein